MLWCSAQGGSNEPLVQIKQQVKQDRDPTKKLEVLRASHVTGMLGVLHQLTQLSQLSVCHDSLFLFEKTHSGFFSQSTIFSSLVAESEELFHEVRNRSSPFFTPSLQTSKLNDRLYAVEGRLSGLQGDLKKRPAKYFLEPDNDFTPVNVPEVEERPFFTEANRPPHVCEVCIPRFSRSSRPFSPFGIAFGSARTGGQLFRKFLCLISSPNPLPNPTQP